MGNSCSAVLKGEFYIFDDLHDMADYSESANTIKKITNCGLELIGVMPFEFYKTASCGTYFFPDERIFMCYGEVDSVLAASSGTDKCRRYFFDYCVIMEIMVLSYDGKTFWKHSDLLYEHTELRSLKDVGIWEFHCTANF